MWTCGPCDTTNPDDRMFCRICGKMKVSGWKAPEVNPDEAHEALQEEDRPDTLPEPPLPEYTGHRSLPGLGFVVTWTGLMLVALGFGWWLQSIIIQVAFTLSPTVDWEGVGVRVLIMIAAAITYGPSVALSQWILLARYVPRGNAVVWVGVSTVGLLLGDLPYLFVPDMGRESAGWAPMVLFGLLHGMAGLVQAFAQARLLHHWRPGGRWRGWVYGVFAVSVCVGTTHRLMQEWAGNDFDLATMTLRLVPGYVLYCVGTGWVMAAVLRRAASEVEDPARVAPSDSSP